MNRRSLITGLGAILAAPAIVRASSLMPVKAWKDEVRYKCTERFLVGQYGTVKVSGFGEFGTDLGFPMGQGEPYYVGAKTPVVAGDYVVIENGYARTAMAMDFLDSNAPRRMVYALSDSKHLYRNILKPSVT